MTCSKIEWFGVWFHYEITNSKLQLPNALFYNIFHTRHNPFLKSQIIPNLFKYSTNPKLYYSYLK